MNSNKIALTLLLAICPAMSNASAPQAVKIGIKAAAGTLVTGGKLVTVAKGAAIVASLGFVAETARCIYLSNGKPEESAKIFQNDLKFAQEKSNEAAESVIKFGFEKSAQGKELLNKTKEFFDSKFGKKDQN